MKGLHHFNLGWICAFFAKLILITIIIKHHDATATRVSVSGIINPVKEGGLLSISCQIWNLNNDDQVTFFRMLKDRTETLSMNDDILSSVEDNVFLATRHLADGSVIYFLTITHVTVLDAGEYSCKVSTVIDLLSIDSVRITVHYFPKTTPLCLPSSLPVLKEGSRLTLNCSSDTGNPVVEMQWERSGTLVNTAPTITKSGKLFSEIHLIVSMQLQNAMFICKITNPLFPAETQTCHVGPLRVLSNGIHPPDSGSDGFPVTQSLSPYTVAHPTKTPSDVQVNTNLKEQCAEVCSKNNANSLQWKIATLVAVAAAAVFLVCGILLFVMVKTIDKHDNEIIQSDVIPREQLYTELNQKLDDSKVYIALQRQAKRDAPSSRNDSISSDLHGSRKY